jgi:hypothetical protein
MTWKSKVITQFRIQSGCVWKLCPCNVCRDLAVSNWQPFLGQSIAALVNRGVGFLRLLSVYMLAAALHTSSKASMRFLWRMGAAAYSTTG